MVWLDGQGLRKHRIGGLVIRKTWEEVFRWIFRNGQSVKILLPQVKSHQRASMAEEVLNNQMAKRAPPWMSAAPLCSLSIACSAHSCTTCWWSQKWRLFMGSKICIYLTKADLAGPLLYLPPAETNVEYSTYHRSEEIHLAAWCQVDSTEHFHYGEDSDLFSSTQPEYKAPGISERRESGSLTSIPNNPQC